MVLCSKAPTRPTFALGRIGDAIQVQRILVGEVIEHLNTQRKTPPGPEEMTACQIRSGKRGPAHEMTGERGLSTTGRVGDNTDPRNTTSQPGESSKRRWLVGKEVTTYVARLLCSFPGLFVTEDEVDPVVKVRGDILALEGAPVPPDEVVSISGYQDRTCPEVGNSDKAT